MGPRPWILILLLLLALVALRPEPRVDGLLERLLGPTRFLAQTTWPIARLGRVEISTAEAAAESGALPLAEAERAASARVLERWYESALPQRAEGRIGRRLVPGEVLGRAALRRDQLLVRPWSLEGLVPGLPAVVRDAYIGRIGQVDTKRGLVRVDLVTGNNFHVGASVRDAAGRELCRLVVGGIATAGRVQGGEPKTWLAAHHPSRADDAAGWGGSLVVVDELLPSLDPHGTLAAGYELGRFAPGGDGDWRVEPVLDFLHGLSSVVLLAPGAPSGAELPPPPAHPLEQPLWLAAHAFNAGDPSPWRASARLDRGSGGGLEVGAAVVRGARLVGRLGAVSGFGATVRLLADPGLELTVLAERLDTPDEAPLLLGRWVSTGRDPASGQPRFVWRDVVPLPPENGVRTARARLYTAAGDLGLPGGLLLGYADLPLGSSGGAGHVVLLEGAEDAARGEESLWVRQSDSRILDVGGAP